MHLLISSPLESGRSSKVTFQLISVLEWQGRNEHNSTSMYNH
jgi:hypothetical protein